MGVPKSSPSACSNRLIHDPTHTHTHSLGPTITETTEAAIKALYMTIYDAHAYLAAPVDSPQTMEVLDGELNVRVNRVTSKRVTDPTTVRALLVKRIGRENMKASSITSLTETCKIFTLKHKNLHTNNDNTHPKPLNYYA